MSNPTAPSKPRSPSRLRWFLVFGMVGLVVALIMLYALSHELVVADFALIFWPTSMVLLSGGDTIWVKAIVTTLAFAGNFVLYGLFGLLIGAIANRFRRAD